MESKKAFSPVMAIVAIIVGVALYKQFNFQTLRFEKPALAIVYMACFIFAIIVLLRGRRKK